MFEIDHLANQREAAGLPVIRMTLGKSERPLHPDIIRAMQSSLEHNIKSKLVRPSGLEELKEKLKNYYADTYRASLNPENIIIGPGTGYLIKSLMELHLTPEDEILLPRPYYSLYYFCALLTGATIRYYSIDPHDLSLDMDSFRDNFNTKTKIVVLNSPGNPLGNIISRQELEQIDRLINGQALIISDEIYSNICFDEKSTSFLELDHPRSQCVVTSGFSKGYRMYTRRVGYCIVPDSLVTPLNVMMQHTMLTVDPVVQYGALCALDLQSEVEEIRTLYQQRCAYTLEAFSRHSLVRAIPSRGGFYLTLDCQSYIHRSGLADSLELARNILRDTGVATVPGEDFGLPATLRLSFTSSRYCEGIDLLAQYLQ